MTRRFASIASIMTALTMLMTAPPARAQTKMVTLGAAVQLTGKLGNTGRYYRDAYQLAVDRINEKGGVTAGGIKYKLALVVLDSQSDVNLGMRQYVQLIIRNKVDFLLGPYSSDDTISDSSVAEKYEIPMVSGGASSTQIFSRGYKYIFGTLPEAGKYFSSTIEMMAKLSPRPATVGLISANDAFDVSVAEGTRALVKEANLKLGADQQFTENGADFSSLLSLIKSAPPDVLLWSGHEPEALNFIRQMKSLDVNPKDFYSLTVGIPTADFRKALGNDAEFAFGMTPWLPTPVLKDAWFGDAAQFAKLYQDKFGYAPDYHAASAVADVEVYAKAIEAAGSIEPKKVRDAITKVNFATVYSRIHFRANGQVDLPLIVIQIQNGQVVPIYTESFVNKPRYPILPWGKRG